MTVSNASRTTFFSQEGSSFSGPVADAAGNLFATQLVSYADRLGPNGEYGDVVEIATDDATPTGYAASPLPLATLISVYDGSGVFIGGLAGDGAGDLFAWVSGFQAGAGQEYEIAHDDNSATGYAAAPTLLATFYGSAQEPDGGQVVDEAGDVFGTAQYGGENYDGGVVYEVARDDAAATGYDATPVVIASFGGANGSTPQNLTIDAAGDLFGTTYEPVNGGIEIANEQVFEIARDPTSATGYAAAPSVIASFPGAPIYDSSALIVDGGGDLFAGAAGSLYEIARDDATANGYAATPTMLAQLSVASLIVDAAGNLFGVSTAPAAPAEVFELACDDATTTGYAAAPTFYDFPTGGSGAADDLTAVEAGDEHVLVYGQSTIVSVGPEPAPCYCRGTLILTERGELAVETLAEGDRVVTRSGEMKPIRWIGRRGYAGYLAASNPAVLPVCIKAGALADYIPKRDLWVSPEHALLLDDALVPAGGLVNDLSILKAEAVESVEYFHLELDAHDVIFAEGAAAETFVDDDSRGLFHNAPAYYATHPEAMRPGPARYCAPRLEEGLELEALRERLAARGARLTKMGTAPAAEILGHVDRCDRTAISGWALDASAPQRRVGVAVVCNGAILARLTAEDFRPDLIAAGRGDGRCAFTLSLDGALPLDRVCEIELRALDGWTLLPGGAVTLAAEPTPLTLAPLRGRLDAATGAEVMGWAFAGAAPVSLIVSANGFDLGTVIARQFRADLQNDGLGDGRHGFRFAFPGLDRREPQEIRVRRETDGAELENSPFLLPPTEQASEALTAAVTRLQQAAALAADEDQAVTALVAATETLLQRRAAREGGAAAREAQRQFRRRWGREAEPETAQPRPRALAIDERAPDAGRDAGSVALLSHLRGLRALGYDVAFAAFDGAALDEPGVTSLGRPHYASVEDVLSRHTGGFDLVYLHRLVSAERYLRLARAYQSAARIVYSVADLHHLRLARQARVEARPELLALARAVERDERRLAAEADLTLTHSPVEARLLGGKARVVPFAVSPRAALPAFAARRGLAFLGSFGHAPNLDAAFWLTREILPRVWAKAPHIVARIAGHGWRAGALGPLDARVEIVGAVDLDALFGAVRLTCAPLRFGAGIKGKVLESFAAGLPCALSEIAVEGLSVVGQGYDDPDALAAEILRLHEDEGYNAAISAGVKVAAASYTQARVTAALAEALGWAQSRVAGDG